jgi:hypothetical protein
VSFRNNSKGYAALPHGFALFKLES